MAAVSLFWNTNMAAVTSRENALHVFSRHLISETTHPSESTTHRKRKTDECKKGSLITSSTFVLLQSWISHNACDDSHGHSLPSHLSSFVKACGIIIWRGGSKISKVGLKIKLHPPPHPLNLS